MRQIYGVQLEETATVRGSLKNAWITLLGHGLLWVGAGLLPSVSYAKKRADPEPILTERGTIAQINQDACSSFGPGVKVQFCDQSNPPTDPSQCDNWLTQDGRFNSDQINGVISTANLISEPLVINLPPGKFPISRPLKISRSKVSIVGSATPQSIDTRLILTPDFEWTHECKVVKDLIDTHLLQKTGTNGGYVGSAYQPYAIAIDADCVTLANIELASSGLERSLYASTTSMTDLKQIEYGVEEIYRNCDFSTYPEGDWYNRARYTREYGRLKFLKRRSDPKISLKPILIKISTNERRLSGYRKEPLPISNITLAHLQAKPPSDLKISPVKNVSLSRVSIQSFVENRSTLAFATSEWSKDNSGTWVCTPNPNLSSVSGLNLGSDFSSSYVSISNFKFKGSTCSEISGIGFDPPGIHSNPVTYVQIEDSETFGGFNGLWFAGAEHVGIIGHHSFGNSRTNMFHPGDTGVGVSDIHILDSVFMRNLGDRDPRAPNTHYGLITLSGKPSTLYKPNTTTGFYAATLESNPLGQTLSNKWAIQRPEYEIIKSGDSSISFSNTIFQSMDPQDKLVVEWQGLNHLSFESCTFKGGATGFLASHLIVNDGFCGYTYNFYRSKGALSLTAFTEDVPSCTTLQVPGASFDSGLSLPETLRRIRQMIYLPKADTSFDIRSDLIGSDSPWIFKFDTFEKFSAAIENLKLEHSPTLINSGTFDGQSEEAISFAHGTIQVHHSQFLKSTPGAMIVIGPGVHDMALRSNQYSNTAANPILAKIAPRRSDNRTGVEEGLTYQGIMGLVNLPNTFTEGYVIRAWISENISAQPNSKVLSAPEAGTLQFTSEFSSRPTLLIPNQYITGGMVTKGDRVLFGDNVFDIPYPQKSCSVRNSGALIMGVWELLPQTQMIRPGFQVFDQASGQVYRAHKFLVRGTGQIPVEYFEKLEGVPVATCN